MRSSNFFLFLAIALMPLCNDVFANTLIKNLESNRKKLLSQIRQVKNLISKTENNFKKNLEQIRIINKQIEVNIQLIENIDNEIKQLDEEINMKKNNISILNSDLGKLKVEYAHIVAEGYKAMRGLNKVVFLLSSKSFNQLYDRVKYVKSYVKFREKNLKQIKVVSKKLHDEKLIQEQYRSVKKNLHKLRLVELENLKKAKEECDKLAQQLQTEKEMLYLELDINNSKKIELDKNIKKIIDEELIRNKQRQSEKKQQRSSHDLKDRKVFEDSLSKKVKSKSNNKTKKIKESEDQYGEDLRNKITKKFEAQRGKLIWPVDNPVVIGKFGTSKHPVLPNIKVENIGIIVRTKANSSVRAVFDGVVSGVVNIPQLHNVVILEHGDFHTVYVMLSDVNVKNGDVVSKGDLLGVVFTDDNDYAEFQFQIWRKDVKLNPILWLLKFAD